MELQMELSVFFVNTKIASTEQIYYRTASVPNFIYLKESKLVTMLRDFSSYYEYLNCLDLYLFVLLAHCQEVVNKEAHSVHPQSINIPKKASADNY